LIAVVDIGNTNTVIGLFKGDSLAADWRLESKKQRTADEYCLFIRSLLDGAKLQDEQISGAILSSVVPPLTATFKSVLKRLLNVIPLVVGPGLKTGMPILYDNPREVGADRIVNSVAAYEHFKQGTIIVDFGTATTFDVVSPKGEYLGGAISPGLFIANEALFHRASKLPRVELAKPKRIVGKNTVESIQSGVFFGFVSLVDGMVRKIRSEIDFPSRVIATGGIASVLVSATKTIEEVDEHLTLKGLKILFERNR